MTNYDLAFSNKPEHSWTGQRGVVKDIKFVVEKQENVYGDEVHVSALEVETDKGRWKWVPEGDCCAVAHLQNDDTVREGMAALKGQEILAAFETSLPQIKKNEDGDDDDKEYWGDVRDTHWYTLKGDKSSVTFVLYVDHNGYYGGELELEEYEART